MDSKMSITVPTVEVFGQLRTLHGHRLANRADRMEIRQNVIEKVSSSRKKASFGRNVARELIGL